MYDSQYRIYREGFHTSFEVLIHSQPQNTERNPDQQSLDTAMER